VVGKFFYSRDTDFMPEAGIAFGYTEIAVFSSSTNKSPKYLSNPPTDYTESTHSFPHEFSNHRLAGTKPFQRLPILVNMFGRV
jgi:hypothetical protein